MPTVPFLIFMYFVGWLIIYSYSKTIYDIKNKYSTLISILIYSLLMIFYGFVVRNAVVNIVLSLICNVSLIYFCFKSSFKSSLFHGISLGITQLIAEFITLYATSFITSAPPDNFVNNDTVFVLDFIISKIIYFLITRILIRFSVRESKSKSWGKWYILSILPISTTLSVITVCALTYGKSLSARDNVLCIISSALLLIINIVIYMIYEQSEKSNQKLIELEVMSQKDEIDLQYLNILETKNDNMQIMAHDYKHHVMAIDSMTDSTEIKEYLQKILGEINQYNKVAKTKNRILDVILNKYIDICSQKNIAFEIDTISDNFSFMSDLDISALFNNLLDNAVEAAENSETKNIYLKLSIGMQSFHKIEITNTCADPPKSKGEKLITTKSNKDIHGFGIKSINKTISKYQGEIQWNYDEESRLFKTIIAFPICK